MIQDNVGQGSGSLLSARQLAIVTGLGIAFWYAAAVFIRYAAESGYLGGGAGVVTFGLCFPGSWLTVWLIRRAAGLSARQVVTGVGIATGVAAFCDGTALTWYPVLYGETAERVVLGAGSILWGVGCLMLTAYLDAYWLGER